LAALEMNDYLVLQLWWKQRRPWDWRIYPALRQEATEKGIILLGNCKQNSGIKDYLNSRRYVSQLMINVMNYLPIIFRSKFLQYSTFVRLKILPHNTL